MDSPDQVTRTDYLEEEVLDHEPVLERDFKSHEAFFFLEGATGAPLSSGSGKPSEASRTGWGLNRVSAKMAARVMSLETTKGLPRNILEGALDRGKEK